MSFFFRGTSFRMISLRPHPGRTFHMHRTLPPPPPAIKIPASRWDAPDRALDAPGIPTPWFLRPRKPCRLTVPKAKGPKNGDTWATKYCFSAKVQLYTHVGGPPVGVVFTFDRNSDVTKQVEAVVAALVQDTGYVSGQTELIMHKECPMEITDEVYVHLFDEKRGLGSQDET